MDVCEEVLDRKMAALELREGIAVINGEGSDSGVEFVGASSRETAAGVGVLERALSSNSGGYASSAGGYEDAAGTVSCNSSMVSFCSDTCEKTLSGMLIQRHDCTSEGGGSESSSVSGQPLTSRRSVGKKKVAVSEPPAPKTALVKKTADPGVLRARGRATSATRSTPFLATSERARSREKVPQPPFTTLTRTNSVRRPTKLDTQAPLKDVSSPQKSTITRTPSLSRGRTPGVTPTDDRRWPSVGSRNGPTVPRAGRLSTPTSDVVNVKTRLGILALEKSSPLDKYGTLPRRRKEMPSEEAEKTSRSNSMSRDVSRSRRSTPKDSPAKTLPVYPRTPKKASPKTKIYHEMSIQTAITSQDVADAFAGSAKYIDAHAPETTSTGVQSDIRDREIEALETTVNRLKEDQMSLQNSLAERAQQINAMQQELMREREEKLLIQRELQSNSERVFAMLESVHVTPCSEAESADSLMILESKLTTDVHVAEQQKAEISKLRWICNSLQRDLQQSLEREKVLIEDRESADKEAHELQEFLHNEKVSLMDALKEAEVETQSWQHKCRQKDADIERLQEECRHLVRTTEQRRQENMGMQAKYGALEARSKDLICQQSAAVSGASVALSNLGSRLDNLVEQLISSYNISEQDLEDVVYHNEAYSQSASSGEGSPEFEIAKKLAASNNDGSLSPQRSHSFIAVVINAIRNATAIHRQQPEAPASAARKDTAALSIEDSDSTEMLDSETEPCLMMENVLEDVTLPDSHSQNLVSSSGMALSQIECPTEMMKHDDSLNNLSQAIANRQQIELQTSLMRDVRSCLRQQSGENSLSEDISVHESMAEIPSISEFGSAQTLVDQVIHVDNLVTRLLKVLRIVQLDNDNCIQHLISDKNKLQVNKDEMVEKLKDWEGVNSKLKGELTDASQQLCQKANDLALSRTELQKHRAEIDRLNEDICNLSTLCQSGVKMMTKEDVLATIQSWKVDGSVPEPELISSIVTACQEIPSLREHFLLKERQLFGGSGQIISEAKKQYEAIDRALEILNGCQSIVDQCPALRKLQSDLEETNFKATETISLFSALLGTANASSPDMNANAASSTNGNRGLELTVDSTA
ncbi:uncharacterized protein LOC132264086 [Phlebotomus argentipes]|uniref:uncharacterized protein LOC132264086 n=1 Tax=Phlebotomus argentipes TaxID=94469 RepID=UPI002892A2E0|nr:uncharacterized protein LOC132264086 [Phlebotomus argentipes]